MTVGPPLAAYPPGDDDETASLFGEAWRRFARRHVDPARIDADGRLPDEVLAGCRAIGAFGLAIGSRHGGAGLGPRGVLTALREIARSDPAVVATVGAHQVLACRVIERFGDPALQRRVLPACAAGERIAAFCLTEPDGGSAVGELRTRARSDGAGGFVLHGTKTFITNGGLADLFVVLCKLADGSGGDRLTAFVVERGAGVTSGPDLGKLGVRGSSTTEVHLDGVRVPADGVLGRVGGGAEVLFDAMTSGRLTAAALSLGLLDRIVELADAHARQRVVGGGPIARFGLVQDKLATMHSSRYAADAMVELTASLVERGVSGLHVEASCAKVLASEITWAAASEALQIAGGAGYMTALPFERLLRDARVNTLLEGTSEVVRLHIGAHRVRGVGGRLADVGRALGVVSDPASGELGPALRAFRERVARADDALVGIRAVREPRYGARQRVQARVADLAIDLLAMYCALSRGAADPSPRGAILARHFCRAAARRVDQNLALAVTDPDAADAASLVGSDG